MRFHVYFDRADVMSPLQLMTEPLDLVGTAGTTSFKGNRDRARYEIHSVEAPAWMDVIEFRDWLDDYYVLTKRYGAMPTWERHVWEQLRKMLPREEDQGSQNARRRISAICYLLKGNLRSPGRVAARMQLQSWIDRREDFKQHEHAVFEADLSNLAMAGYYKRHTADAVWQRVNPDYPWYSAELEIHQAALEKAAVRMRKLVQKAEAQRMQYAPRLIPVTNDDLLALGDVF